MKISAILISVMLPVSAFGAEIKFVTESYPPFNYREGGRYKGSSVEQVEHLMKVVQIPYTMEMMPWARAIFLAEEQPMHCVFTTVHNSERHPKFKWVEPLLTSRTVLIRKTGSAADPKTLEEAKSFKVGTQRDDYTQTILQENQFPDIDLATDLELTMKKLLSGRIDLMPIAEKYYDRLKREGAPIESTVVLSENIYSIACHRNVPDETIEKMQTALGELIADGTQARLFEKYRVDSDK